MQRWAEEVKTLHGKFEQSRVAKLANYIVLSLLPAAAESLKRLKKEEEEESVVSFGGRSSVAQLTAPYRPDEQLAVRGVPKVC